MNQGTHWLPERWRQSLADLRNDIYEIAERWLSRRRGREATSNGQLPVRYQKQMDAVDEGGLMSRPWVSSPAIDLDETEDEIVVATDLPGLDPNDFSVEISGARLVIRGEKKHEMRREAHGFRYQERGYGAFARAIPLPYEVDADKAQANYNRGVLRITLPKTERAKAKRVKIQNHA